MLKRQIAIIAALVALAAAFWSCGNVDNTENFLTYFNTYYNMERIMDECEEEFEYQEEGKRVEPRVYVPQPKFYIPETATTGPPEFMREFVITKQQRQPVKIKLDSIILKGSKIIAKHPNSDFVEGSLFLMAQTFFYREEWLNSQIKCSELIDKYPSGDFSPDAHLLMAKNYLVRRKFSEGKLLLSRTVDIAWQKRRWDILSEAFRLEAEVGLYEDDVDGALRPYRQAIAQSENERMRARWRIDLAGILYRLSMFERAEEEFRKARTHRPDYLAAFESRLYEAGSMSRLGRIEEAVEILERLENDGNNKEWLDFTFAERMNILRYEGKDEEFLEAEKAADSLYPSSKATLAVYFERGLDYYEANDYLKARQYIAKARTTRSPVFKTSERLYKLLNDWDTKRRDAIPLLQKWFERQKRQDSLAALGIFPEEDVAVETLDTIPPEKNKSDGIIDSTGNIDVSKITAGEEPPANIPPNAVADDVSANISVSSIDTNLTAPSDGAQQAIENLKRLRKQKENKTNKIKDVVPTRDSSDMFLAYRLFELGRVHEELGNPDSTVMYYNLATRVTPPNDPASARYIYAYGRMFEESDPWKADSLYQILIDEYPTTVYGQDILKKWGHTDAFVIDTAADLYRSGAKLQRAKDFNFAIERFWKIYEDHPESDYAPRGLYAVGWIYENEFDNIEKAIFYYTLLREKYPATKYAQEVSVSIDYYLVKITDSEIPDSLKTKIVKIPPSKINDIINAPPPQTPNDPRLQPEDEPDPEEIIKNPMKFFKNKAKELAPGKVIDKAKEKFEETKDKIQLPDSNTFKPGSLKDRFDDFKNKIGADSTQTEDLPPDKPKKEENEEEEPEK